MTLVLGSFVTYWAHWFFMYAAAANHAYGHEHGHETWPELIIPILLTIIVAIFFIWCAYRILKYGAKA